MDGGDKTASQAQNEVGWQYKSESGSGEPFAQGANVTSQQATQDDSVGTVEWSASEFVAHEKNVGWYAVLALIAIFLAVGVYVITRDVFSVIVVVTMSVALGVAGARKPRVVNYRLDRSGLTVGKVFHPYREYKSFAMPEDGPFSVIVLVPMKRFGLPLSAYLAPDSQQKALEVLASHLPMERGELDTVDQLMRQLRF